MQHLDLASLELGLDHIRSSPATGGTLELIVCRPVANEREVCETATLDPAEGLVGDSWRRRGSRLTSDGSAEPARQITIMSSRAIALIAQTQDRWALAGDQLYVDFDLSVDALPPGSRLAIGGAVLEVSAEPHTGCAKFRDRFGVDAQRFVSTEHGRALRLRGLNARVVGPGDVRVGDRVERLPV